MQSEVEMHRAVQSDNVLQLVDSQLVESTSGDSIGYLLFPFYQVIISSAT